jgi:hypothetical protein
VRQELEFAESQYAALALAKAERLERARVTRIQNMLDSGKDIEENDAGTDAKEEMKYTYLENKWLKWLGECGDEVEFDPMSGPTLMHMRHFTSYIFQNRDSYSTTGKTGLSESVCKQVCMLRVLCFALSCAS